MIDEPGLIALWAEIEQDPHYEHLRTPGIRLVPGVGAKDPFAFVVGEAPGGTENLKGKPFVGASGHVLRQLMAIAGLYAYPDFSSGSEDHPETIGEIDLNVWLTNTVKYRPPGNRTPNVREIMDATPYLRKEYKLVGSPKLIIMVGSVAANAMGILNIPHRGDLFPLRGGVWYCCQYHPAYGMRGGDQRKEMIERQWEAMADNIEVLRKAGEL